MVELGDLKVKRKNIMNAKRKLLIVLSALFVFSSWLRLQNEDKKVHAVTDAVITLTKSATDRYFIR